MKTTILISGLLLFWMPFLISYLFSLGKSEGIKINLLYGKDPRYFGKSFRKKIRSKLEKLRTPGVYKINLSKQEHVKTGKFSFIYSTLFPNFVYIIVDKAKLEKETFILKEIYALKEIEIDSDSTLRAVACDGRCIIKNRVNIIRWLDCEGDIYIGEDCNLGVITSSGKSISLKKGTTFTKLYGLPVKTYKVKNISFHRTIKGDVTGKEVYISEETPVLIKGNIIADRKIFLKNVVVEGNVFTFGELHMENVLVGSEEKIFSVIGSSVSLSENVQIYGYIQASYKKGSIT